MLRYHLHVAITIVLLLKIFHKCFSIHTPPRSPSPVATELLSFDDDMSPSLLPIRSKSTEEEPSKVHHSSTAYEKIVRSDSKNHKIMKMKEGSLKRNRKRKYSDEERLIRKRESRIRWEEKKRKEDPEYSAKLYRTRKEIEQLRILTGIEIKGKAGRPRKNPKTDV
ncbi:uncharacterized protein FA14DRAFT_159035 [Meira miltonrushii]|uniref:Uncharacterized protein n=1 Tax=Meira miltonrushii TaxID=1280837 RepID=A0A316VG80_9BASI|nr:uncharacterized protein FA14DRAFT_159035 [Meira miltonrushii]PWN36536.1 hypothetical protein FA14DRAFT_159035 [Meira miltonrushii]